MKLKKILATVLTLALMASAAVCIPFTASAEYSGTKYTFEGFNANIYSGGGGVSGAIWSKGTDDGTYLRYKNPGWADFYGNPAIMSVCKGGNPLENSNDKIGFTLGKEYNIQIEYRYPASAGGSYNWINMNVETTLLNDGNVGNYNSAYNHTLFTLTKDNVSNDWQTYTGSITVPDSFDGTAATSNIGIVFEPQASCWTSAVTFDIKSVTITPAINPEQDDMTIDFSNYTEKFFADNGNGVAQNTSFSKWAINSEDENKYLTLSKTAVAEDFTLGNYNYGADDGFNLICNQAGTASYYEDKTYINDAFILKNNTKYFITLRYKLKFTDGDNGTVPVKMMHTGYHATGSATLGECGIENSGVTLSETDEWKTIAFSATNKCTAWEEWNCFGLGFYDETVIDRNFELCVDEVTISSTDPLYGDADGNNAIDIRDLVRVKRYSAGVTAEINEKRADLNFDGAIDSADLTLLRKQLIG